MKLSHVALVALLSAAVPTAAFAQQSIVEGPDASSTTDAGMADAANEPMFDDFSEFITGFSSADFTSSPELIDSATTFRIERLSAMPNADGAAMASAMEPRAGELEGLRTSLSNSTSATAALADAGVTADQVVWAQGSDGIVTLYVSDFAM